MKKQSPKNVVELPGMRSSSSGPMYHYVVNLQSLTFPKASMRSVVTSGYSRQAEAFTNKLAELVKRKGLEDQLELSSEISNLPVVGLRCTPAVAELAKHLPGVSGIYADDASYREQAVAVTIPARGARDRTLPVPRKRKTSVGTKSKEITSSKATGLKIRK